jgi:hypothetical protein
MEEQKSNLPEEYVIEAKKLLDRHMQKTKKYLDKVKTYGNKGRDFSSAEEKKLNLEFKQSLKELKIKYNIL